MNKPQDITPLGSIDTYTNMFNSMPVGILLIDHLGKIAYTNEYASVMTGYSAEEIIKGYWLCHPDSSGMKDLFERVCRKESLGQNSETRIIRKDSSDLYVSLSWQIIPGNQTSEEFIQLVLVDTTSSRREIDALKISEDKYRSIVESSHDTIMINTPDATLTYISPACIELLGYTPEEFIGTIPMVVHPEDIKLTEELFNRALSGISGTNVEYRIITKDGDVRWISHSWSAVFSGSELKMIVSVMKNITDQKNTEEALRKSETRYRGLIESQFDLIVRVDNENRFTFVNEAYCQMFGKSSDELLGKSFMPLVHEEDIPETLKAMELLKIPPYRTYVEQRALTVNGWRWLAWEDCAIKDENGKTAEIQAIGRDITDRRAAMEALTQSEARLRALVSNITGAVYRSLLDYEYTMEFLSDAIEMISGYPAQDFINNRARTYASIIHPEDRDMVWTNGLKFIQNREPFVLEYRILHADGSIRWVLDKGQAVFSEDGSILSLDGIIFDITARKHAEEELRKAYDIQKEFLNNITHEVRTPLTAVQGYVQMLIEGSLGPVSKEQTAILKKVLTSSDHLLSIVTGVLEVARAKSGVIRLQHKACNPYQIINKVITSVMPEAARKRLYISVEKPERKHVGMYDEQKLMIILSNLLTNAVKFTEKGGIDIKVSSNRRGTEIIIIDSGVGIKPDEMVSIFDEFRQLDYINKNKPAGFGIGLTIVATMVEAINATLTVSSDINTGTAFTLFAPKLEG